MSLFKRKRGREMENHTDYDNDERQAEEIAQRIRRVEMQVAARKAALEVERRRVLPGTP